MNHFQGDTAAIRALSIERQTGRLLRLRFPRNDAPQGVFMLANSLDSFESLSRDYSHVVEVLSDSATIEPDAMLGKMATVELVREDGTLRYFNGYVFEFGFVKTDGGFAFYRMVLEPWLSYLQLRHNSVAFHGKTVRELTEAVCQHYTSRDLRERILGDDPAITYVCQHNETDHNLLQRHWEKRGWTYVYQQRADGHTLVLTDDTLRTAEPIDGKRSDIPFQAQAGSSEDDGISKWSPTRRIGSGKMTVVSFNFKHPKPKRYERISSLRHGEHAPLEVYDNTGAYGFKDFADGEALAQQRMEELDSRRTEFTAEGNDRTAQPGRWFTLSGHFGGRGLSTAEQTKYLIVSVRHRASNNYQDGSGAESSYSNEIVCMPHIRPWRPGRDFNSVQPRIYGVQTAIVVGPAGEEIYTDEYGRVKVQFHWDRVGEFNEFSSPWVRVASGWAGSRFGMISVPRIGMEVVIVFLDGNIERPLIVGCLYNALTMPPWALPANRTQSGVLTRSSNEGQAEHANALRFEDKKGAEEVWLHAEKDLRTEIENDEGHSVGNDRRKTVDRDEIVAVKRDRAATVGHNETTSIVNDRSEDVGRHETIRVGGNRTERVGRNESLTISGSKTERIVKGKEESVGLAKALSVGGLYQVTVGAAMNTTVGASQTSQVAASKHTTVGNVFGIKAGDEFSIQVGSSLFMMRSDGTVRISGSRIEIESTGPTIINGKDVEINSVKGSDISPQAPDEQQKLPQFDEQIRFELVDKGALANTRYKLYLDDGSILEGITDDTGRTERIQTESPQAISSVEFYTESSHSCACTLTNDHAETGAGGEPAARKKLEAIQTNSTDVGTSYVEVSIPWQETGRALTAGETAMARDIFKDAVDYSQVKVHRGGLLGIPNLNNNAMTPRGEIHLPDKSYREDFSATEEHFPKILFIHEMAHVWQFQLGYSLVFNGAIILAKGGYNSGAPAYQYNLGGKDRDKKFYQFNMEQQASIIAHYFAATVLKNEEFIFMEDGLRRTLIQFILNPKDSSLLPTTTDF
jgi:type VI secretion system secreted protein VgrG